MHMKRVTGIGGIFFKSANQQQMKEWYAKNLGLAIMSADQGPRRPVASFLLLYP